jgi:hypothetical protein
LNKEQYRLRPYLYPFKLNTSAPPAWQTFHNLTTGKAQTAIQDFSAQQTTTDLPHTAELLDNSDESDFDPEEPAPADTSVDIEDLQPAPIDSDSDEEHMVPASPAPPMPTGRSSRVRQAPVSFKAPAKQTTYQRYNSDVDFRTTRDKLVNTKVRKFVPGHGTFQGIITSYYPITDNYHILYDDGDEEVANYASLQKYIDQRAGPSSLKRTRLLQWAANCWRIVWLLVKTRLSSTYVTTMMIAVS